MQSAGHPDAAGTVHGADQIRGLGLPETEVAPHREQRSQNKATLSPFVLKPQFFPMGLLMSQIPPFHVKTGTPTYWAQPEPMIGAQQTLLHPSLTTTCLHFQKRKLTQGG